MDVMKDSDKLALNSFSPDNNLYLYLDIKDSSSPLKVRNCKILSVPFLGRMLRWLGYTTKPFEKVISYLLSEKGGLKDLNEKDAALKEKIKVKIDHFFFDKNTQKLKHQKLWQKIKAQYEGCFGKSHAFSPQSSSVSISTKESEEKFDQKMDWTIQKGLQVRHAIIPDSLKRHLPKANYFVTFCGGQRFELEAKKEELKEFIERAKKKNDYPCVIIASRFGRNAEKIQLPLVNIDQKSYPIFQLNYEGVFPNASFCDDEFNKNQVLAIKAALLELQDKNIQESKTS